jgi:ABC-2 type transport system permease protein
MINTKIVILLRREFWEHKTLMLYLPAAACGLFLISVIGMIFFSNASTGTAEASISGSVVSLGIDKLSELTEAERMAVLGKVFMLSSYPFLLVSLVVSLSYLLVSMFNERKDGSILFWKSMPVSDGLTVTSKLVTGLFVIPMVYLAFCFVAQLLSLLLVTGLFLSHDYAVWDMLWRPINPLAHMFLLFCYQLLQSFWTAPWFGFALLISAWAKSAPVGWFLGIPVVIVILERVYSPGEVFSVSEWLWAHSLPLLTMNGEGFDLNWLTMDFPGMLQGILVGMLFIGGAVWSRGKHNEI